MFCAHSRYVYNLCPPTWKTYRIAIFVPHSHHAVTGANEQFLKNVLATCCGYPHETMTAVNYICSPNLHTPFITTFKHENLCKLQFVLLTRDVFYYFLAIGESNYEFSKTMPPGTWQAWPNCTGWGATWVASVGKSFDWVDWNRDLRWWSLMKHHDGGWHHDIGLSRAVVP